MVQRILPIYHTGWLYLLLIFWIFSFWFFSNGGLNQVNQLNIEILDKTAPNKTLSNDKNALASPDILTLYSSFEDPEIAAIATLLSMYPQNQVTLLGELSSTFTVKLENYLSDNPRKNKVIIASANSSSELALKSPSPMLFSTTLDWFRYSPKSDLKQLSSKYLIYTPFLVNQQQSFSMLWQQKSKTYLSLPGEILQQLSENKEFTLNKSWQLNLTNEENIPFTQTFTLGFFGDVFTSGETALSQQDKELQPNALNNLDRTIHSLPSVNQFIEQHLGPTSDKFSSTEYKVIIITDGELPQYKLLPPLLNKLIKNDYLSQDISTIILFLALTALSLCLVWFIGLLTFKQQLITLVSYCLFLFIIQYFMFRQQQWLAVLPIIFFLTGTWLLLLAYHKECNLLLSAVNEQLSRSNHASLTSAMAINTQKLTKSKSNTTQKKSADTLLAQAKGKAKPVPLSPVKLPIINTSPTPEGLEQTLVILEQSEQRQATHNHHLTMENFGRYQVEGILGKGAMGIVYQGVDPKINRHVAIKTLQLSDDIDSPEFDEAKERFFREAQTAGGLSHANIVTIYDVGEENNLGYIAMDLLTGAPLSLFTQPEQTLPVPLVYQLLMQITDALDYAHNQNVVHRDIKPANIIYDDDLLKVTVTDFGIAYVSDNSKTRTGIIMGSPYYMSPEQILGLKVDGRSDIFSLGVTFYQLLCGHLPFEGESIATVAYQITKAKAVAVNLHNNKLPASAQRICNKAMHKDIEKRYQSMAEFKLALINALKRDFKISAS